MTKLNRTLEVCSFCYSYHQLYLKGEQFSYGKKEKVAQCTCCGHSMCEDCQRNANKELHGSILSQYGFTICRECIVSFWRTLTRQEELEEQVEQAIKYVHEVIQKNIYTLTEKYKCQK